MRILMGEVGLHALHKLIRQAVVAEHEHRVRNAGLEEHCLLVGCFFTG